MSDVEENSISKNKSLTEGGAIIAPSEIMAGTSQAVCPEGTTNIESGDIGQATNDLDLDLDQMNDNIGDFFADDNLSLEVNFGALDSCRASDVSSLSFQNVVLEDDADNADFSRSENIEITDSRRGSGDSSDSLPNDFSNDADVQTFSGALEEEIKRKASGQEAKDSNKIDTVDSEVSQEMLDDILGEDDSCNTGTMKRKSSTKNSSGSSEKTSASSYEKMSVCESSEHSDSNSSSRQSQGGSSFPSQTQSQNTLPPSLSTQIIASQNSCQDGKSIQGQGHPDQIQSDGEPGHRYEEHVGRQKQPNHVKDETLAAKIDHNNKAIGKGLGDSAAQLEINSVQQSTSVPISTMEHVSVKKRNSLEIRNNIPNTKEAKYYDSDQGIDMKKIHVQTAGVASKIKKKSPGLACRLTGLDGNQDSRESSSSEKETLDASPAIDTTVVSAQKMFENKIHSDGLAAIAALSANSQRAVPHPYPEDEPISHPIQPRPKGPKGADVENEYDYVKYARVQSGDSYVGMRLAYSSSNDSLNFNKKNHNESIRSSDDDHFPGSSRETSPEKVVRNNSDGMGVRVSKVNEETLTEIPLNGSDLMLNDDQKNFSLSPEATECDSAEVESVLSDEEGKSSTSGMPAVEDGLSSSQGSDTEDTSTQDTHRPAEILKRKYKAEIDGEMESANYNWRSSSMSSLSQKSSSSKPESEKQEKVEMALQDIKSAIQKSKSMPLKAPYTEDDESKEEPVWIMRMGEDPSLERDSYVRKLQRQEEMRRVREEIERQQEEEYMKRETEDGTDNKVVDIKTVYQYPKVDNPAVSPGIPTGREYDTEEEYAEHDRHLNEYSGIQTPQKRKGGKTYAALPEEDTSASNSPYHSHQGTQKCTNYSDLVNSRYTKAKSQSSINQQTDFYPDDISHSSSHLPQSKSYHTDMPYGQENNSNYSDDGATSKHSTGPNSNSTNYAPSSHFTKSGLYRDAEYNMKEYHDESPDEEDLYDENGELRKPSAYVRRGHQDGDYDTDEETDELLDKQYTREEKVEIPELDRPPAEKRRSRAKEVVLRDPDDETVLIEGVLFRARYLGSTQLISEGQPSKAMRMMQAQEAVGRIKTLGTLHFGNKYQAPEGENQPSTDVDLFVSSEKIMVLNTDLQEIMMDHALRTISYIADIGDILVIMARRRTVINPGDDLLRRKRQSKILCHVFESDEAQLIAQSIGQAFQVAYMEFLKANGIEDPGLMKEMDYQEVLNQQEIFGEELFLFSNKEMQKEVIVPKLKGEALGVVIVESGWGSMVPTVVLANMNPTGAAARCGQLNIGDQIISLNGVSLVGLPLSSCQNYIKAAKGQTVCKLTVVSCPPVVEVLIKRPDVKYQLGFSVQNGVICSLLRGGIAERGGVRVGHRIIEINGQSVVAVAHEKIVSMLATSVGEIQMKTMPTSIYRLLTGQDVPHYI